VGKVLEFEEELATSYLASDPTRVASKWLQVKHGVVHLANIGHVFSVARGDSLRVFLQKDYLIQELNRLCWKNYWTKTWVLLLVI
jgi:hypothetical protein